MKDGFLMIRDFDGWEQIYYHAPDGKLKQKLTTGKNWRTQIQRVDEKTQTVYYRSKYNIHLPTVLQPNIVRAVTRYHPGKRNQLKRLQTGKKLKDIFK